MDFKNMNIKDLMKLYEEAFREKNKEKIKQFILACIYNKIRDEQFFEQFYKILEIEVKDNG